MNESEVMQLDSCTWREIIESENYPVVKQYKLKLMKTIALALAAFTLIMAGFFYLDHDPRTGWSVMFTIFVVMLISYIVLRTWKNTVFVTFLEATAIVVVAFRYLIVNNVTYGMNASAWMWLLLLPMGCIYFGGILWGGLFSCIIGTFGTLLLYTPFLGFDLIGYDTSSIMWFPYIYGVATVIALLIQYEIGRYRVLQEKNSSSQKEMIQSGSDKIEELTLHSILAIANAVDDKDPFMQKHSIRVAEYAVKIASQLNWSKDEIFNLYCIALLHDIGKIRVPEMVLKKNGPLTPEERKIMQNHVSAGAEILEDLTMLAHASEVAKYHHERYDGKGYSEGLQGEEIPIEARIVMIADCYDAMTSDRAYRTDPGQFYEVEQLLAGSGTQFDPQLVEILINLLDSGKLAEKSVLDEFLNRSTESEMLLRRVITEFTQLSKMLARKDALTNLVNREDAKMQINTYLCDKRHKGALLILDLDNFKMINDQLGHTAGDNALITFAKILTKAVREADIVCRLGGDEFIIFMREMTDRDSIINKVTYIITETKSEVSPTSLHRVVSASVGIAMAQQDGETFDELYQNADSALYYVKNNGKSGYFFYGEDDKTA